MGSQMEQGGFDFDGGPAASLLNGYLNGTNSANDSSAAQFQQAVEQILLKNVKTHRISLLITSSFSLAAALLVVLVIFSDARAVRRARLSTPKSGFYTNSLWSAIHKAEVMPLAIAIASIIQSCAILAVQSQTLDTFWATGCTLTAQLIWPVIWLVAITVTAFSLESTFRSLQAVRFEPRKKRHLTVSLILIVLFCLALFIVAHVLPSKDVCFGSLVWWAIHFVQPSVALAAGIILVNIVTGIVMVIQLMKTVEMCRDERIAGSRVVYSLMINIAIMAILLPFFVLFIIGKMNKPASLMADIIVTLNGLVHGVVHLFLRTNSEPTAIRSGSIPWIKNRPLRLFGPNDLNIHTFISTPLISDREVERTMLYPYNKRKSSLYKNASFDAEQNSILPRQQYISIYPDLLPTTTDFPGITTPKPATISSRYSIFPTERTSKRKTSLPTVLRPQPPQSLPAAKPRSRSHSSIYSTVSSFPRQSEIFDKTLRPPQPSFIPHRRSDSTTTSATVEIGFRFSNTNPFTQPSQAWKSTSSLQQNAKAPEPALLSPDKYVPAARLAEEFRSRPTTPVRAVNKAVEGVEVKKPAEPARIPALPTAPNANKKTVQRSISGSIRDSLSAKLIGSKRRPATDKSLPPVPAEEQSQESAALEAIIHASARSLTIAPLKQAAPDWRQATSRDRVGALKTITKETAKSPGSPDQLSKTPPEGWL